MEFDPRFYRAALIMRVVAVVSLLGNIDLS